MTRLSEIKAAAEAGPPMPVEGERVHPCQLMGPGTWIDRDRSDCPHYERLAAHRDWLVERVEELHAALDMLWVHYLLVISDEQKDQVRAALARLEGSP